jgi:hypothetical protein
MKNHFGECSKILEAFSMIENDDTCSLHYHCDAFMQSNFVVISYSSTVMNILIGHIPFFSV